MTRARIVEDPAERAVLLEVTREAYPPSLPPLAFHAARLASPHRARAEWWVGEDDDGRVVSSLVAYPLSFGTPGGDRVEGIGLGAVGTLPASRRLGHASRLCREVLEHAASRGRPAALLFSAIPPRFYERLGFETCPAWDFRTTALPDLARAASPSLLVPADPRREAGTFVELYEAFHEGRLHLLRDEGIWRQEVDWARGDWYFTVGSPPRGYVRLAQDADSLEIIECVLMDPEDEPSVLAAIAGLTLELARPLLSGWLEPTPFVTTHLADAGRASTLPMVRTLESAKTARFWGSDYF